MSGLPASGPLSLDEIHVEVGGSSGTIVTLNDTDVRALAGIPSGAIDVASFRGVSSSVFDSATNLPTYGSPSNNYNPTYGSGSGSAGNWNMGATTSTSNGTQYFDKSGDVALSANTTYECSYDITYTSNVLRFATYFRLAYATSVLSGFYTSNDATRSALPDLETIALYQEGVGFQKRTASGLVTVNGSSTGTNRVQGTFNFTTPGLTAYQALQISTPSNPNGNSQSASVTVHSLTLKEV